MKFKIMVGGFHGEWGNEGEPTFDTMKEALEWIKENKKDYIFDYLDEKREHTLMICPIFEKDQSPTENRTVEETTI